MHNSQSVLISSVFCLLLGCTPKPQAIEYGFDACDACRMTIVDERHAAELVTAKGRVYKFDAVECMVPYFNEHEAENPFAMVLVCDYNEPGSFVDGQEAHYLICDAIPSPMGANLSALASSDAAEELAVEKGGMVHDWTSIRLQLSR